jgi:hypothetical protein
MSILTISEVEKVDVVVPFDYFVEKVREIDTIGICKDESGNFPVGEIPKEVFRKDVLKDGREYRNLGVIVLERGVCGECVRRREFLDLEFERMRGIYRDFDNAGFHPIVPMKFERKEGYLFSLNPYDRKRDCIFERPRGNLDPYYCGVIDYDLDVGEKWFDRVRVRFV